uniref:Uncharacterized protein n=1 Tax=Ditylum brightwellii TaxID=49249 RepID=A0A6V2PRY9_9STRA
MTTENSDVNMNEGHDESQSSSAEAESNTAMDTDEAKGNERKVDATSDDESESVDSEEERRQAIEAMKIYESIELRKKLLIVQQQLHNFHDLAAEMDQLKARNSQLRDKVSGLKEERVKREEKVKKVVGKKVRELEDEIIGLKLELAQSRGKEDYQNAEMRKVMEEKKQLEVEVETLQKTKF